jgi:alpha-aminoadipic semialdehyde synthase
LLILITKMDVHGNGVVGILRETKNKWERRSPLAPSDVAALVREHGLRVLVQPSARRVFADAEFAAAGAELAEDL